MYKKYWTEQPLEGGIEWFQRVDLTVIAVCIPSMYDPMVIRQMNYNRAVPMSMSQEWNEEKFYLIYRYRRRYFHPIPLISLQTVDFPIGTIRPMFIDIHL